VDTLPAPQALEKPEQLDALGGDAIVSSDCDDNIDLTSAILDCPTVQLAVKKHSPAVP
jgi:hypothetical protein